MSRIGACAVLLLLVAPASCAAYRKAMSKVETAAADLLVSPEQEAALGRQLHEELGRQGAKYVSDPAVLARVDRVAKRVFAVAARERPDQQFKVFVVDEPKTVNAFATPGGYLYVDSGLLGAVASDSELAGVLSHEVGHVVARHAARSMVDKLGLEVVKAMALGKDSSELASAATDLLASGALLAHSRDDETEADEYGARFTTAAGYDPYGLVTFLRKLEKLEGDRPAFTVFLSDHPLTPDRVQHLEEYIVEKKLAPAAKPPDAPAKTGP